MNCKETPPGRAGFFISIRVLVGPSIDSEDRSDSSVTLKWNASNGTLGYRLYIGSRSNSYQQVADVGLLTTSMVSNLSGDTTYYFVVTAYNSVGESCASNEVSARIQ
ncbi:MAG: fibronectin type III domain-containing protein [Nitrospira sp.]|nr:fibronectin type III domain-containing protein [Nitrospira sp.]